MLKKIPKQLPVSLFFLAVAAYFIFLQWNYVFPDPDSFYHTKMAVLMGQQGLITSFPWIKFASFTKNFTDHHFLYHLILVPFVKFIPPLIGMKIATTLLAWLSILSFYLFLKKQHIRYALGYSMILLSIVPFVFRMNLAKTSAISIIILLLALNFIWRKQYLFLFVTSFLYVWTYGGWILLPFLVICHIFSQLIIQPDSPDSFTKRLKFVDWKILWATSLGCISGLIFNPYFPHNLYFYWEQIIQIGLLNYQNQLPVGVEWYPMPPLDLLAVSVFGFVLLIFGILAFAGKIYHNSETLSSESKTEFQNFFSLFIFAGILGVMTLKSQRFIEYFAPFFILANAALLNFSLPKNFSIKNFIAENFGKNIWSKILLAPLIIVFVIYLIIGVVKIKPEISNRFSWNYLKGAATWLKENTPDKSLVFHSIWSDSTILFFHNDHNVYITGLDPTFFYRFNPKLYEEWTWIREAKIGKSLAQKLKNDFGTKYMLVKNEEKNLLDILEKNLDFTVAYTDAECKIYALK